MLFLIGAVSLNVMPFFLPRPRNSWVSGSSVELPKALLWIRKPLCAITSRYSQQVKASPGVSPGRFGFQCEAALSKESVVIVVFLSFLVVVLCRRRRTGHNPWSPDRDRLSRRPVRRSERRLCRYPANLPADSAEDPFFNHPYKVPRARVVGSTLALVFELPLYLAPAPPGPEG